MAVPLPFQGSTTGKKGIMQHTTDAPKVKWHSERQKQVAIAAGYRIVDGGQLQVLQKKGEHDDGTHHHIIAAVRPASLAEQVLWNLLMKGEAEWSSWSN